MSAGSTNVKGVLRSVVRHWTEQKCGIFYFCFELSCGHTMKNRRQGNCNTVLRPSKTSRCMECLRLQALSPEHYLR